MIKRTLQRLFFRHKGTMSTTTPLISVSLQDLATAFEKWEQGYRLNPQEYRSHEECLFLGVTQVSAERAEYFHQLLVSGQQP